MPPQKSEPLISAAEVAAVLGIKEKTVITWAQRSLVTAYRVGPRLWRFRLSEVIRDSVSDMVKNGGKLPPELVEEEREAKAAAQAKAGGAKVTKPAGASPVTRPAESDPQKRLGQEMKSLLHRFGV